MSKEDLENIMREVLSRLYRNDNELLRKGVEWAISHRLAVYLEPYFNGWHIDCEYRKMGPEYQTKHNSEGNDRRPDIVIHRRGLTSKENNLLVIEVKYENSDTSDFDKLKDFTSEPNEKRLFQYEFGLAISFHQNEKLDWFQDGRNITEVL